MRKKTTTRRDLFVRRTARTVVSVLLLLTMLVLPASAEWLPTTGDGVDLWIVRQSTGGERAITILHRRDLEEPTNRIYQVRTLTGKLAGAGLASAGDRLWIVYENLQVQSLPVTISENVERERYGEPRPEPTLPTPAKLWSITANQNGPWALVRLDSESALASLTPPEEVAATAPATTMPTTMPASRASMRSAAMSKLAAIAAVTAGPPAPSTQPTTQPAFAPVDALLQLKRNRWVSRPLPEDWLPEARNFVLMLRATDEEPVLVSLRPDPESPDPGTQVVVYRKNAEGWHRRSYSLPQTVDPAAGVTGSIVGSGSARAASNEPFPLAIDGQLVVASLSFVPAPIPPDPEAATTQHATTAPAQPASSDPKKPAPIPGTLSLDMAILGDGVSSITPLVVSHQKPDAVSMVAVRQSLAIILSDEKGNLSWGIVDLHGKLEGAVTALAPRDEQVTFGQSGWLVPVFLLASAVLIMFARMRKDSPAATPTFPEGFVAADFIRRALAFFFDLAPCVVITTIIFGIEAPVLIGHWWILNVGWDVMLPRLVVVGIFVLHTGISEAFSAKSFGKSVLGLKVIATNGNPPTLGQVIIRNFLKIFDLIAWPLLFLPLMRPYGQRLGDLAARTVVVMPEPDEDDDEEDPM